MNFSVNEYHKKYNYNGIWVSDSTLSIINYVIYKSHDKENGSILSWSPISLIVVRSAIMSYWVVFLVSVISLGISPTYQVNNFRSSMN